MQSTRLAFRVLTVAFAAALLGACATTDEPVEDMTPTEPAETTETTPDPGAVTTEDVTGTDIGDEYGSASQSGLEGFAGADRVLFEYDSSELTSDARGLLARQAEWLNYHSGIDVVIEGHCDERGTREYNLALGERRATAVKSYLVALGIPERRLDTISYGKERPAVVGRSESSWAQNRRGVLRVQ